MKRTIICLAALLLIGGLVLTGCASKKCNCPNNLNEAYKPRR